MDEAQAPHNIRRKCAECGLVNAGSDVVCRRCGAPLDEPEIEVSADFAERQDGTVKKTRTLWKRLVWVVGATLTILVIWYLSLLFTSDGLQQNQRDQVHAAIAVLDQKGFTREAFVLRYLATFRTSDNWLNAYVGHRDAYAATNFPFEVVTLYPEFFSLPADDTERGAVLLHEARHLCGDGEDAALQITWKSKRQLGWTFEKYSHTRVWDATEDLTRQRFPYMFQCGANEQTDCF
jgi:hypothetical protein